MSVVDALPPGAQVPSPCVGICRLDAAGATCVGCGRTLAEVAGWSTATEAFKRAVWQRIGAARESGDA
jgi:predicted Fe-S protein YdhL (DUF1289 family)